MRSKRFVSLNLWVSLKTYSLSTSFSRQKLGWPMSASLSNLRSRLLLPYGTHTHEIEIEWHWGCDRMRMRLIEIEWNRMRLKKIKFVLECDWMGLIKNDRDWWRLRSRCNEIAIDWDWIQLNEIEKDKGCYWIRLIKNKWRLIEIELHWSCRLCRE
jgi:hypothetical protein